MLRNLGRFPANNYRNYPQENVFPFLFSNLKPAPILGLTCSSVEANRSVLIHTSYKSTCSSLFTGCSVWTYWAIWIHSSQWLWFRKFTLHECCWSVLKYIFTTFVSWVDDSQIKQLSRSHTAIPTEPCANQWECVTLHFFSVSFVNKVVKSKIRLCKDVGSMEWIISLYSNSGLCMSFLHYS